MRDLTSENTEIRLQQLLDGDPFPPFEQKDLDMVRTSLHNHIPASQLKRWLTYPEFGERVREHIIMWVLQKLNEENANGKENVPVS